MLALARSLRDGEGLDAVFTAGTDFSTTVSYVAERLGLPCVPLAAAERATDKRLMRRGARGRRGAVPGIRRVRRPRRSRGGRGSASPAAGGEARRQHGLAGRAPGRIGRRAARSLRRRPGRIAYGARRHRRVHGRSRAEPRRDRRAAAKRSSAAWPTGSSGSRRSSSRWGTRCGRSSRAAERRSVEEVFRAGIRALGIDNGAAKGDLKLTSRGPMVGEIAARLSGGYMSGWTFPLASGVEVTAAGLRVAAGLDPGDLSPDAALDLGGAGVHLHPGCRPRRGWDRGGAGRSPGCARCSCSRPRVARSYSRPATWRRRAT